MALRSQPTEKPESFISARVEALAIIIIVIAFTALAIGFSLGPILEAPDEPAHYIYARNLILNQALPDPVVHTYVQDHQAPLYYVLMIPFILAADGKDPSIEMPAKNPFWGVEIGETGNDNKNLRLHSVSENFPYEGSRIARVIHVTRLLSLILGLATLIVSYLAFRGIWPESPLYRILGTSVVAFWPQFVWLSSVLNNDNLLIFASAASLCIAVWQIRSGPSLKLSILQGLALSIAALSKATGALLILPVGFSFLLDRRSWRFSIVTLLVVLLLGAWWYARNMALTGTLSGWIPSPTDAGVINGGAPDFAVGFSRLPFAYQGFWARFANVSVPVVRPVYIIFDVLSVASIVGVVISISRKIWTSGSAGSTSWKNLMLLSSYTAYSVFGLLYLASTVYTTNQGRYALSAITAWAGLIVVGLTALIPQRFKTQGVLSISAIMAFIAVSSLFVSYTPAFKPLPVTSTPEKELAFRFGDHADLIGMSPAVPKGQPGELITINLFWRSIRPVSDELITYLHSVDSDVVRRDSYPATGNLLSTEWVPEQVWEERYLVRIPKDAQPQEAYPLIVGQYDAETKEQTPVFDGNGNETNAIIGLIGINGNPASISAPYKLGDIAALGEPEIKLSDNHLEVCLSWQALAESVINYHIFIHVIDADGTLLTQADLEPRQGVYPTSAWRSGEIIKDCTQLDLSKIDTTGWTIRIGLYDPATMVRLPVTRSGKGSIIDNSVVVSP